MMVMLKMVMVVIQNVRLNQVGHVQGELVLNRVFV